MARYFCNNCDDKSFKTTNLVVDHISQKHSIMVTQDVEFDGYRCEDCDLYLRKLIPFLSHMDKVHGLHIWYEKGLTKKKIFFDGTLNKPEKDIINDSKEYSEKIENNSKYIPISKRPYFPRKKSEYTDENL